MFVRKILLEVERLHSNILRIFKTLSFFTYYAKMKTRTVFKILTKAFLFRKKTEQTNKNIATINTTTCT